MRLSQAVAALATVVYVSAKDFPVTVGAGALAFSPNQITGAVKGDTVTFELHPKNHSVTQSTFANPCQLAPGGSHSGFMVTDPAATQFSKYQITIENDTAPLWFMCAQTVGAVHCHMGMVFAVNPTADKSFEAFQKNANSSTVAFTDPSPQAPGGAAPAPSAPGSTVGQTQAGAPGGSAPTNVVGNTNAPAAPTGGPIATTGGNIPASQTPDPATSLPTGAAGAAGNSTSTPGSGAIRMSGVSASLVAAAVVAMLL
jgi:hypothetical protein